VAVKDYHSASSPHEEAGALPLAVRLRAAVDHASHLLPAQGPITVFIHHNTLHALEQLPFDQALARGAAVFGCQPYLSEARYRDALGKGRIRVPDLRAVLQDELGSAATEVLARLSSRFDLRLAQLQYPFATGSAAELQWLIAETDALRRVRSDASAAARIRFISETRRWVMRDLRIGNGANPAWVGELFSRFGLAEIESWSDATWEAFALEALWRVCQTGARLTPVQTPPVSPLIRHRDLLLRVSGVDADLPIHPLLIRFTAAFLDQGVSHWPLPDRERGFFKSFCALYSQPGGPPERWMKGLTAEAARLLASNVTPADSACESLALLGVPPEEWEEYLSASLMALRGWAGMVLQVAIRADSVAHPIPRDSLLEFAAVRLLLERFAVAHVARQSLGYDGPLEHLRDALRTRIVSPTARSDEERAFPIFHLAQIFGWSPAELSRLTKDEWAQLVQEVEAFPEIERRRVFHLAYETRFRTQTLDALALHERQTIRNPRFQVVTCLDDREESFRRHIEEVAPDCQTFGVAGFFAIPMYYRGANDAHFIPLCPIVITPKHWVEEQAEAKAADAHQRLRRTQRLIGVATHGAHVGSRTAAIGAILTGTIGALASIPLVARILFPRLTARVRNLFGKVFSAPPQTRLQLERQPECVPAKRNGHLGFTLDEMVNMTERLLRDIGLINGFSRLVFTIGHGSNSLNNPHKSAYDCGACGGSPGAPNGRAAAAMLNDSRVRAGLAERGIAIPETTRFVGGYHNTCDDTVTLFDLDDIPDSHRAEFEAIGRDIEETCARNAHERCRRFMSAPLTLTFAEAKQHVEGRSEDLAQTRPELGHATNAICHVGRRERTRGLFFDRRAFITAYDPTQDDENGTILARTMAAIFPVCGGINLEYFFSHVDSAGYGCGTKLPHNITSLLGVMDGAASDLRTGLPWQMTEIHEPVRLVIVCETTPAVMQKVLDGNPLGKTLTENGWVILALQSPHSQEILLFDKGEFRPYRPQADELPRAASSVAWYRGWRDHLEFAEIVPAHATQT